MDCQSSLSGWDWRWTLLFTKIIPAWPLTFSLQPNQVSQLSMEYIQSCGQKFKSTVCCVLPILGSTTAAMWGIFLTAPTETFVIRNILYSSRIVCARLYLVSALFVPWSIRWEMWNIGLGLLSSHWPRVSMGSCQGWVWQCCMGQDVWQCCMDQYKRPLKSLFTFWLNMGALATDPGSPSPLFSLYCCQWKEHPIPRVPRGSLEWPFVPGYNPNHSDKLDRKGTEVIGL